MNELMLNAIGTIVAECIQANVNKRQRDYIS